MELMSELEDYSISELSELSIFETTCAILIRYIISCN
jgi:hypothetical protein